MKLGKSGADRIQENMDTVETNAELLFSNWVRTLDTLENMKHNVSSTMIPVLRNVYEAHHRSIVRCEIVDLFGTIATPESEGLLISIARSRTHFLVRYYAMRNLIE